MLIAFFFYLEMPLLLDWHSHECLPCAPGSRAMVLPRSLTPLPTPCTETTAASKILKCLKTRKINRSCLCILFFLYPFPTTRSLSSHLSDFSVSGSHFWLALYKNFFLGMENTVNTWTPWPRPFLEDLQTHYPAAAEWFLSLDLQMLGRPGEIFLFWLDKAWE